MEIEDVVKIEDVIFNIMTGYEVPKKKLPERCDFISEKLQEIRNLCDDLEKQIIEVDHNVSDKDLQIVYESLRDSAAEIKGSLLFLES
jgi:pentose-5-phosphate-3-epimerase